MARARNNDQDRNRGPQLPPLGGVMGEGLPAGAFMEGIMDMAGMAGAGIPPNFPAGLMEEFAERVGADLPGEWAAAAEVGWADKRADKNFCRECFSTSFAHHLHISYKLI